MGKGSDCPKTGKKPDPARIQFLRMLPQKTKDLLTPEEINAIRCDDVWPDSLKEKLKDYIVDD